MPSIYRVSSIVERNIDGQWFHAEVVAVRSFHGGGRGADDEVVLTLKYLDDGNEEDNVDPDEVRPLDRESSAASLMNSSAGGPSLPPRKKSTLPKPLVGLMEDDEEERTTHQTRVILHNEDDIGTKFIYITSSHVACIFDELNYFGRRSSGSDQWIDS